MRILILNGPNLNLTGSRETTIYGEVPMEIFINSLREQFTGHEIGYYQTNHEGSILDKLHEVGFSTNGILLNAGAYSHTSLAIADAIAAIETPVIEVHISNTAAREEFRHRSVIARACRGTITGFGLESYTLGLIYFLSKAQG